jgi:hypothetical protein
MKFILYHTVHHTKNTQLFTRHGYWCSGGSRETLYLVARPDCSSSGTESLWNLTVRFFEAVLTKSGETLHSGSVFSALSIGAIYISRGVFVLEL